MQRGNNKPSITILIDHNPTKNWHVLESPTLTKLTSETQHNVKLFKKSVNNKFLHQRKTVLKITLQCTPHRQLDIRSHRACFLHFCSPPVFYTGGGCRSCEGALFSKKSWWHCFLFCSHPQDLSSPSSGVHIFEAHRTQHFWLREQRYFTE